MGPSEIVLEIYDADHSDREDRYKSIGPIWKGLVLVAWTEREDDRVRLISARWASVNERELYRRYVEKMR